MSSTLLKFGILAASASQALASCAYGTILHPRGAEIEVNHFGYTGANGPANWQSLDPKANAMCNTGTHQSPINMVTGNFSVIPAAELDIAIPDFENGAEFENLGTTCEVVGGKGTISFKNVTYTFKQFHFHLPSEHLDNGLSMAMEMHAVWQSEEGQIAVIGTFIDLDEELDDQEEESEESSSEEKRDSKLRMGRRTAVKAKSARREATKEQAKGRRELPSTDGTFFHVNAPSTGGTTHSELLETVLGCIGKIAKPGTVTETEPLLMSEVVDVWNKGSFQTYEGSLTTPPCKEGVRWLVSDQKFSISTKTFLKARTVIGFNSRFPQNTLGEPNVLSLGH